MITRPRVRPHAVKGPNIRAEQQCVYQRCRYATAAAITPAVPIEEMHNQTHTLQRHPPNAPPALKPAFLRKSQLHRQYTSLLRSTPLMLVFQHNNLKANEWAAVRRELALALDKVSASSTSGIIPGNFDPASDIRIQTIQKGVFGAALRVVEFYKPAGVSPEQLQQDMSIPPLDQRPSLGDATHSLSREAYLATLGKNNPRKKKPNARWRYDHRPSAHQKKSTPLHALLHGPVALLTFPTVTPQHLAAAISILAPTPGSSSAFPAPKRRTNPGYYDPPMQAGLQKLLLLGARIEGRTIDGDGIRWVGGLASSGGLEGLRAQLVSMLQGVGGGITSALEGASKALWMTMESRRSVLEEETKPKEDPKEGQEAAKSS